ncbi:hypothetical protein C8N30_2738 [Sulfitobacter guttiformis]|uniref:Uncharacterized protein n=1 Tax=Sulfitobacter guttiformis TaxID=74349 RepID=A0A420DHE9_9RHOB|nr:hypothetical protein C8N30_2738 [Sulfitobacter guttiformis]
MFYFDLTNRSSPDKFRDVVTATLSLAALLFFVPAA